MQPGDGSFKKLDGPQNHDYSEPAGPVIVGRDDNLYGVSAEHGAFPVGGSVSKITADGYSTTLHTFSDTNGSYEGGSDPIAPLVQDHDTGTLYGVTRYGGTDPGRARHPGGGTIYSVTPAGDFKSLFSFNYFKADNRTNKTGIYPNLLVFASDGNLYGTTYQGGTLGGGVFFRLSPKSGEYRVLYEFPVHNTQYSPVLSLVEGPNMKIYGLVNYFNLSSPYIFEFDIKKSR